MTYILQSNAPPPPEHKNICVSSPCSIKEKVLMNTFFSSRVKLIKAIQEKRETVNTIIMNWNGYTISLNNVQGYSHKILSLSSKVKPFLSLKQIYHKNKVKLIGK